jgi:hypothetical protein
LALTIQRGGGMSGLHLHHRHADCSNALGLTTAPRYDAIDR